MSTVINGHKHTLIITNKKNIVLNNVTCDKTTESGLGQYAYGIDIQEKGTIVEACTLQGEFGVGINQGASAYNCIIRGCTIEDARTGISGHRGLIALYNLIIAKQYNNYKCIGIGIYASLYGKERTVIMGNMIHIDGRGIDCGAIRGGLIANNIITYITNTDFLNYKSIIIWNNTPGQKSKNALVVNNVLHKKDVEVTGDCENITTANNKIVEEFK